MSAVAVIQARHTSTRLPGKMLLRFEGLSVIEHLVLRLRRAPGVNRIAVSVPEGDEQAPLVEHVRGLTDLLLSRGPTDDILKRMLNAGEEAGAERVVRIFGDSPMIDPLVVGRLLAEHAESESAWARVDMSSGWPLGNECQSFDTDLLRTVDGEAKTFEERQDLQPYLLRFPERFRVAEVARPGPESRIDLMLDTPADRDKLASVFARLYPADPCFGVDAVEALAAADPAVFGLERTA